MSFPDMTNVTVSSEPVDLTPEVALATPAQLAYLSDLLDKRDVLATHEGRMLFAGATTDEIPQAVAGLKPHLAEWPKARVSAWIDALVKAPAPREPQAADLPEVPDGRYAIDWDGTLAFFRVKIDGKRVRVYRQASDELHWAPKLQWPAILQAILDQGAEASSKRYGLELGHCGVCGRTLTDEDSRAAGIGPVCAGKMGW